MTPPVMCKGCFKVIENPFPENGGQCFHDLTCTFKYMRRYGDRLVTQLAAQEKNNP